MSLRRRLLPSGMRLFADDPRFCGRLRQGNIPLIHSGTHTFPRRAEKAVDRADSTYGLITDRGGARISGRDAPSSSPSSAPVDVLDVGPLAQMRDQAPESGGFEFRSGFVVNGHGRYPAVAEFQLLCGACHIFCHIAA
jgi:hypothetical protein